MMLFMDPPGHTRYRKLVNRGFTPRMIAALEPHVRELTVGILDAALAKGDCDFVVDVAAELPLEVIAELLGVPREDRHKLFDWSNRMVGSEDPEYQVSDEHVTQAQVEMFMYAQQLAELRRAAPQQDIVTTLLNAEVDGDTAVGDGLQPVLHAAVGGRQRDDPQRHRPRHERLPGAPRAVGPAGRGPGGPHRRRGRGDPPVGVAGHVLPAQRPPRRHARWAGDQGRREDQPLVHLGQPGRVGVRGRPFRFDITRDPNPHIAFGGGGPHFCLGAQLARLEIRLLFEELAARVARLEALAEPDRLRSNFIGGIKHLPVRLPTA